MTAPAWWADLASAQKTPASHGQGKVMEFQRLDQLAAFGPTWVREMLRHTVRRGGPAQILAFDRHAHHDAFGIATGHGA